MLTGNPELKRAPSYHRRLKEQFTSQVLLISGHMYLEVSK